MAERKLMIDENGRYRRNTHMRKTREREEVSDFDVLFDLYGIEGGSEEEMEAELEYMIDCSFGDFR